MPDSDRFVTRLLPPGAREQRRSDALLGKFKSKDGDLSVYGPGRLLIIKDTGDAKCGD